MATRYSRQKIFEKFEFWNRELVKLDESKSPLIDRLIEHFGENVVLSLDDNEEYGMSVEIKCDLTKLADEFRAAILNARAKILENDEDKNIVYQTEDLIVEQPKNSSIRIVHMN